MCTAIIATGIGIAGQLISGIGQKNEYDAKAAALRANAQVEENNAKRALVDAKDASERGQIEQDRHYKETDKLKGVQKTSLAASGIDLGAGSAATILEDTNEISEEDAAIIRSNTEKERYGFYSESQAAKQRAENNLAAAKNAKAAGKSALTQSLFSAATQGIMTFGGSATKTTAKPKGYIYPNQDSKAYDSWG